MYYIYMDSGTSNTRAFLIRDDKPVDAFRAQLMAGIISGSVADILEKTIHEKWTDVKKIIVIGGGAYVESYRMLIEEVLPGIPVSVMKSIDGNSFALSGFLELIKQAEK